MRTKIKRKAKARLRLADELAAAARSALEQIELIGIEQWHGAEGLDLAELRSAVAAYRGSL